MSLIKKHWTAVLLAIIVGGITIAPSFYFRHMSGQYQGVDFFHSDAEHNYLAQIQEVYDGHYSLGNIYLKDGKDTPAGIQRPLSAWIVAGLGRLLGMDAADINLYGKFIFPAFLTLIVYSLFLFLTKKKGSALLSTAFVMFASATLSFYFFPFGWWRMLRYGEFSNAEYQFLMFARSINPQISSIFFYGYFTMLFRALYNEHIKKQRWYQISAAVILGLSFYTYFFVFSFLSVFSFLLFIFYIVNRDRERLKTLLYIGLAAIAIALPSLVTFYRATQLPFYTEATQRVGAYLGRTFIFSKLWWGAAIAFVLVYRKIALEPVRYFVAAFLLAGFFLTNQQLITGRMIPAPQHYHWYYLAPMFGALAIALLGILMARFLSYRVRITSVIVGVLLCTYAGILFQKRSYEQYHKTVIEEQRYGNVLAWIKASVPKDAAILGNMTLSPLIVGFTHTNVYYHRGVTDFPLPTERLRHAFFVYLTLDGISTEEAGEYFKEHRNTIGSWLYGEYYRQQFGCNGCFSDEHLQELIRTYKDFSEKDFLDMLVRYPIDYAVWDKEKDPAWGLDRFFGEPVYDDAGILVYKVSANESNSEKIPNK